jgi:poly(A) polymerase
VAPDPVRRLAALLPNETAAAEAAAARLRLSNKQADRLLALAAPDPALTPETGSAGLARALYREGADRARDRVLLAWAAEKANGPRHDSKRTRRWVEMLDAIDGWRRPAFPLGGHDVTAAGVAQGPRVGELLAAVEEWWIAGGFTADREACLAKLRELEAAAPPRQGRP